jgi:hypothetical protein
MTSSLVLLLPLFPPQAACGRPPFPPLHGRHAAQPRHPQLAENSQPGVPLVVMETTQVSSCGGQTETRYLKRLASRCLICGTELP